MKRSMNLGGCRRRLLLAGLSSALSVASALPAQDDAGGGDADKAADPSSVSQAASYDEYCDMAAKAMSKGDLQTALGYLNIAYKMDSSRPRALEIVALLHLRAGGLDRAEDALNRAIAVDPTADRAWSLLALTRQAQGDLDAAIGAAREAVAHDASGQYEHQLLLGDLLYQSGDFGKADGAYQQAIALLEPQLERMVQLERQHSGKEVMREVREEVVYQEVRNPETGFLTHVAVPVTSFDMELSEAPEEILQRQASLRSKLVDCHFGRAKCQFRLGNAEAGAVQTTEAFSYAPEEASSGLNAIVFEDYERAADELEKPGRRARSQPFLLMRYLVTQIALDDIGEAKKTLGRLKRSADREEARWADEALAYFGEYVTYLNGRQITAPEEIDRLAEARAAFYKAQLHLMQGRPELARPFLEQAAAAEAALDLEGKAAAVQLAMLDQPSS